MNIDDNLLSVDVGYSYVKYIYSSNKKIISNKIPTAVLELAENSKINIDDIFEKKGKKYILGEYAELKGAYLELDINKLIEYAPLFILKIIKDNKIDCSDLKIVTGLSIKDIDKANDLIKEITNYLGENKIKTSIDVLPQGRGVAYDFYYEKKDIPKRYVVIDIGYNTFDFISIILNQMDLDDSFANSKGINLILEEIVSNIKNEYSIEYSISELNANLSENNHFIFYRGNKIDITVLIDKAVKNYLSTIKNICDTKAKNSLNVAQEIILAGGGSYLLQQVSKEVFNNVFGNAKISFIEEPEFSNARGYYKRSVKK